MSSVLPSSFSWGFNPKIDESSKNESKPQESNPNAFSPEILASLSSSFNSQASTKNKRRHQDDDDYSFSPRRSNKKNEAKFRIAKKEVSHKKNRALKRILGQPLPTQRIVEVLDKESLQSLLNNLIDLHPEITQDIYKCSPKPKVDSAIDILDQKIKRITSNLPYKVDSTSEYAYLRVKPLIEDFLSALSDYTLHFLPPVESQPSNSLDFLDQATSLLHMLPNFAKSSNNYFKTMAYEQLSHTWCICLKEFIQDTNTLNTNSGLLILMNNNWEQRLKKHNELSGDNLISVVAFFKEEMCWLSDEIKEQHSPTKLSNLINFSPTNSPLHGLKSNLLDG